MTNEHKRAEIAFKALIELDEALNPEQCKPTSTLRRIIREAKQEIDKTISEPIDK